MMLAARGAIRASGAGLPYDAEVEYLESSGTQYINTGIKPGTNTRVEITFAMTTFTANCGLFGACGNATADNNSYNLFIISNNGSRVRWDWSGSGQYQTSEADTSTDATYVLGAAGGNITRNGTTVMSVSASKAAINYPLYVFNFNNVGTPYSTGANARFWSVKIYEGQTLVFDAIPVRKNTVGYLYDRVSGKLFGNAGTGAFSYGSDVVQVEYIQSDGNAYLDTGVVPAPNLDYSVTFSAQSASTYYRIFGAWASSNQKRYGAIINAQNILYHQMTPHGEVLSAYTSPNIMTAEKRGLDCYVNGSKAGSFTSDIEANEVPYSIHVLGINTSGSAIAASAGERVYAFSLSSNSVAVRSMLPVRVGNEGAMMDVLTRRIYRNAGTGAFIYGNDRRYPIPA